MNRLRKSLLKKQTWRSLLALGLLVVSTLSGPAQATSLARNLSPNALASSQTWVRPAVRHVFSKPAASASFHCLSVVLTHAQCQCSFLLPALPRCPNLGLVLVTLRLKSQITHQASEDPLLLS